MRLSIHQPSYFPWLGLLHKIAQSDQYVLMDEVALSDSAFQHRNLFLTNDGKSKYLTIPFVRSGYQSRPFRDLELSDRDWARRHLDFLSNNYRKHPFYNDVMPQIEAVLTARYERLVDVVAASMRLSFQWFGISTRVIAQSDLEYDRSLRRGDLVMALIEACNADVYVSGTGAKAYLDESRFGDSVALEYNRFTHPTYPQKGSEAFVSGLACVDIVFNIGETGAAELLGSCGDGNMS
jgi:hypothetical protein